MTNNSGTDLCRGNASARATRLRVAYFVSPHGFGHAARASAVMAALGRLNPEHVAAFL